MQAIKCEICGSNDIIKKNDYFVCQHCGTKYSLEEAKKLTITVKIDRSEDLENLFVLARRAYAQDNIEEAEDYYGKILLIDPYDWEAVFFKEICSAYTSNSMLHNEFIERVGPCAHKTLEWIKEKEDHENTEKIHDYVGLVLKESLSFAASACFQLKHREKHDDNFTITSQHKKMQNVILQIEKDLNTLFPDQEDTLQIFYQQYYRFLKQLLKKLGFFKRRAEIKRVKVLAGLG